MRVLVILPTYDEADNISEVLHRVRDVVPDADMLVVDDSSPDGTAELAEHVAGELGRIAVMRRPHKTGLGEAYRAGFARGLDEGYDVIVQMDADLSHDPAELPGMLGTLTDGADVVIGSRYIAGGAIPNWPWHRRALSRYGNRYASFVLGSGVRDATSGYRAYRVNTLRAVDYGTTRSKGYGFQIETAYRVSRAGGSITEWPITFTDRVRGHSKMTWRTFAETLLLVTWWGVRDRVFRRKPRPSAT